MSYCRFLEADAYIFQSYSGLECCGCILAKPRKLSQPYKDMFGITHSFEYEKVGPFTTAQEMLDHIKTHREAGHDIPEYVDEKIKKDFPDLNASVVETEEERKERRKQDLLETARRRAKMKKAYEEEQKDK